MRRRLAAVTVAVLVAGCGGSSSDLVGEDLYQQVCASCHGGAGDGGAGPAIGAGSNAVSLTDDQIAGVIEVGPGSMPGFDRLSDEQVASLVDFIRDLQG